MFTKAFAAKKMDTRVNGQLYFRLCAFNCDGCLSNSRISSFSGDQMWCLYEISAAGGVIYHDKKTSVTVKLTSLSPTLVINNSEKPDQIRERLGFRLKQNASELEKDCFIMAKFHKKGSTHILEVNLKHDMQFKNFTFDDVINAMIRNGLKNIVIGSCCLRHSDITFYGSKKRPIKPYGHDIVKSRYRVKEFPENIRKYVINDTSMD